MAKKKSGAHIFVFFLNSLVAILLLIAYALPYISPKSIPVLAVVSLAFPIIFVANILFLIYWIVKLNRRLLLSLILLVIGFSHFDNLYKLSDKEILLNEDTKVMSYNVHLLNYYQFIKEDSIPQKIARFIQKKSPDILAIQEFTNDNSVSFDYPHKYIKTKSKSNLFGLAIFSKYPIINSGSLDLKNSANNIIYADFVKGSDTIRVYNIHLESLKLNPTKENFGEENSEKLVGRLKVAFKKQAAQVEEFIAHEQQWHGKTIICGDFNNTAFSWVYRQISKQKNDAFAVAGKGLGKTYDYAFPLRIDFILTDKSINIHNFKTFDVTYSDHFPIMARLSFKE